jgi:hypothetical protein
VNAARLRAAPKLEVTRTARVTAVVVSFMALYVASELDARGRKDDSVFLE